MKKNLAHRMRPHNIDAFFGQHHIMQQNKVIKSLIDKQQLVNLILFGPPGCGKTTLAMILAQTFKMNYQILNATIHQKKDIENAITYLKQYDGGLLIIDEIHRLNKDKQELLLSYTENSDIIFIGLTSTNPYYQIIQPLRSRCHLIELYPLSVDDINQALEKALTAKEGLNNEYKVEPAVLKRISEMANGDLRTAYNQLELLALTNTSYELTLQDLEDTALNATPFYDTNSIHYYMSGLQKAIRGSDADGALFYLARLIEANNLDEIERRLLVIAYEDIGLANPSLCAQVPIALDAVRKVGLPEGRIILAVITVDLALSPKSPSAYQALDTALATPATQNQDLPPFIKADHLDMHNYAKIPYKYKHYLNYLPKSLSDVQFYHPQTNSEHEKILNQNYLHIKKQKRYLSAKDLLNALQKKTDS